MTLAIFALVLFTIVFLSTYSATLTGNLNSSLTAQSGGYTFYAGTAQPVPDLPGSVRANATLDPLFSVLVPLVTGVGSLVLPKVAGPPYLDEVYSAPSNATGSTNFYSTNQFAFGATLNGMSDARALEQLASGPNVAVLDGNYASGGGFAGLPHPIVSVGSVLEVHNPGTGAARNVTVIGILKETLLPGVWLDPATASALGFTTVNGYLLTVNPGVSADLAAQKIKGAFYQYGLGVLVFADALASTTTLISGQIGLLEVFIALGLAVGIAALGILALRAVTERRREIGVLRAIGLTRMMVLKAFLVEYTFVTLTGAAIGGLLGLLVVYNLTTGPGAADAGVATLYVPWLNLLGVVALTGFLATLAVIGPSARAARLPPAEALRTIG